MSVATRSTMTRCMSTRLADSSRCSAVKIPPSSSADMQNSPFPSVHWETHHVDHSDISVPWMKSLTPRIAHVVTNGAPRYRLRVVLGVGARFRIILQRHILGEGVGPA